MSAFSVNVKSVVEQGFFHEFTFDNKALKKHLSSLNLLKTFEVRKLSNSKLNFVTSLAGADVVGYYRRGDLATSLMPATYFVHGLAGYPPAVMSAHGLPTAAFLSAGVDPLTYATLPTYAASAAAAAAQLQGSAAYDTNVSSDAATTSELSPASTQNGVIDSNGTGNYTPPGYGNFCF